MARFFNRSSSQSASVTASSFNLSGANISVDFWFYPTNLTTADGSGFQYYASYAYGAGGSKEGWWFRTNVSTSFIEFGSWDGTVDHKASWGFGGGGLSINNWYHAAGTWDGTNWTLYINGVQKVQHADATGPQTSNGPFMVGATNVAGTVGRWCSATVAEVTVRNVALNANEVAGLAAGAAAYSVRPSTIVGYFPLWGLASPEPDLSGNAHNLTLTNSPLAESHAPVTLWTPKSRTPPDIAAAATAQVPYNPLPLWGPILAQ